MSNKIGMLHISRSFSSISFPLMFKFVDHKGAFMNKLIGSSNKKRKFYIDDKISTPQYKAASVPKGNKENSRRMTVLNKLFMKSISEILVAGNVSQDVLGKGLEISRVSVNPHFNLVNVFWASNKEENVEELEKILPNLGFSLRHELTQLRTIGVVPRIVFVKDKHFYSALKVDHLLSIADYGEDYEPSPGVSEFKEGTPLLNNAISTDQKGGKAVVEEKPAILEGVTNDVQDSIPEMTHDVFCLNHKMIMEKILKRMNKARALHRYHPNIEIECEGISQDVNSTESVIDIISLEERKEAINNFLLQRKIEKRKLDAILSDRNDSRCEEIEIEIQDDKNDVVDEFYTEDYIDDDYYEEDKKQL